MAGLGRLPGVDLPPRRRKPTHRQESYAKYRLREPSLREWLEPSVKQVTSMDLDEAARKAKSRLEKRLGTYRPSKRRNGTDKEVCGICLENFVEKEQAMGLSCAHKFHFNCLLPWLHAHPDCPYCRTPVSSY